MKFGVLIMALAFAGCGTTPNPASCVDNHCSDPERPFCDKDGSVGGEPNTCIAVSCTPGEFATCNGDNAMHCNALGNNFEELQCMEGCSDAKGCNECEDAGTCAPPTHIVPRYLPEECDELDGGTNDLIVTQSRTIDTSMDANCNGGVIAQSTGPLICVLRYRSIVVAAGQTLKFTGLRAVALVADDAVSIDGLLDIGADLDVNGPGGVDIFGPGIGPGLGMELHGAGGGGYKTKGGRGGIPNLVVGPDNGGPSVPDPAFEPLTGGRHGGGGLGGGGGGAATLISCRGTVSVGGMIDAGGGGGVGGISVIGEIPAAGGGSGGYVVLQGRMVTVTGTLYANGGGGGAGRHAGGGNSGAAGEDGARDLITIGRGGAGVNGAGNGGSGATAEIDMDRDGGMGSMPTTSPSGNGGGGGGGGLGYLQIYTAFGIEPTVTGRTSPLLQPNRKVDLE